MLCRREAMPSFGIPLFPHQHYQQAETRHIFRDVLSSLYCGDGMGGALEEI